MKKNELDKLEIRWASDFDSLAEKGSYSFFEIIEIIRKRCYENFHDNQEYKNILDRFMQFEHISFGFIVANTLHQNYDNIISDYLKNKSKGADRKSTLIGDFSIYIVYAIKTILFSERRDIDTKKLNEFHDYVHKKQFMDESSEKTWASNSSTQNYLKKPEQSTSKMEKCRVCEGRGQVICSFCAGAGYTVDYSVGNYRDHDKIGYGGFKIPCPQCSSGNVICPSCGGSGKTISKYY